MRRPTGPATRTPVAPPSRRREAPAPALDEQPTEPIERLATPAPERAEPAETAKPTRTERTTPRAQSDRTDALAGTSAWRAWLELRRAAAARRRVERREARRFTARTRRQRLVWLISGGVVVAVVGGAVATAFSPVMALRHIEVVGAHSVKAADVRSALSGELGKPLPLVTGDDIRRGLDDFRLIRSYSTQLQPPSTLVVRITERSPLGAVKSGAGYELVDQAGIVISSSATVPAGYPVIEVPNGQQPEDSVPFAAAARVIAALPQDVRKTVTTASATGANDVTLKLQGGKTVVWGGPDQVDLKTAALNALLKGAPQASVYDVSSPDSPVTR